MAKSFKILSEPIDRDPEARAQVDEYKRAIYDALALARIREHSGTTQGQIADAMGVSQANVSRIEAQEDLYVSTLSRYVAAMGGYLELTAVFPGQRVQLNSAASPAAAGHHPTALGA